MEFLLFDILFSAIGKLYMYIRYFEKDRRMEVLRKEFDNSYQLVGKTKILQVFVIVFMVILLAFIVAAIYYDF